MFGKRNDDREYLGKIVVFGDVEYQHDKENFTDKKITQKPIFEMLEIEDIHNDRLITNKQVFPLSDATILNDSEGLVYAFNMSLEYLQETKHLAEVEKNMIIGQAYLYAGKNLLDNNKTSGFQWFLSGALALIAVIAIFV